MPRIQENALIQVQSSAGRTGSEVELPNLAISRPVGERDGYIGFAMEHREGLIRLFPEVRGPLGCREMRLC